MRFLLRSIEEGEGEGDAMKDVILKQLAEALADAGAALTRAALLAPEATPDAEDLSEAGDALARAAEAVRALIDQQKPTGCTGPAGGTKAPG